MKTSRSIFKNRLTFSHSYLIIILVIGTWLKQILLHQIIFDDKLTFVFLIFTLCTTVLIYSWTLLFNQLRLWMALFVALFSGFMMMADLFYYRYFESLIRVESLKIAGQTGDVFESVVNLIKPLDILFWADIIIFIVVWFFLRHKKILPISFKRRLLVFWVVIIIAILPVVTILYQDKDSYLNKYLYHSFDLNLTSLRYGVFGAHAVDFYGYYFLPKKIEVNEKDAAKEWIKRNTIGQQSNSMSGTAKGKNIILIQIESLQSFVIGKKFVGQEITPNINKLVAGSHYYPNGKSVVAGGQTSDSDFATNTSVYPLSSAAVFVRNGGSNFTSLPKALDGAGYGTNAYHAYRRDFWNRGVAFNSLGFEHFYAADEYEKGDNVIMGLNDESFYRQSIDRMKGTKDPSFSYLMSLSSHYPFIMAKNYQMLEGKPEQYDYQTFHYYQAIHYADYALGAFISELKKNNLYDESLIVVYGDHPAKIGNIDDPLVSKTLDGLGADQIKSVPYAYKLPKQSKGYVEEVPTSQVDIMPTILNLAGIKTGYPMFGKDVFSGVPKKISEEDLKKYSEALINNNLFDLFH